MRDQASLPEKGKHDLFVSPAMGKAMIWIMIRIFGFAVCVGIYLLCIEHSREKPALISLGFLAAAVAGVLLYGG